MDDYLSELHSKTDATPSATPAKRIKVCMCTSVCVCVFVCPCLCLHVCIFVSVCVYVYNYYVYI